MNTAWARSICRLLVVLMALAPYQIAHAGMIGTGEAIAAATQAERGTVLNFVTRGDVASQLQALGIDPASATERVAAMTDQEVRALSARIDSLPAGGDAVGVLLLILVVAAIWYVWRGGFR
ncbi:MAG TPA: PA2779 family protein [Burkholderiales bacterium]|nr:PA2779 family protein [Burkholderiales bacterium]